ncbi:MAG: hypothetical protein ACRDTC_20425 [Pseudonocardiaceae bacterium]
MPARMTRDVRHGDLNRHHFLTAVAAAGLLTACGSNATPSPTTPAAGPWTFTDDRGVTVTRPSRPIRIVTNDQAGAALATLGVRPVGIFSSAPMDQNPILEGVDLAGIESVGEVYGEINVEKLAALAPDLVVTPFDPHQDDLPFGFVDGPAQGQVEAFVTIVTIDGIKDPVDVMKRFEQLAAALGADLQAPAIVATRRRFEEAGAARRRRGEARSARRRSLCLTQRGHLVLPARHIPRSASVAAARLGAGGAGRGDRGHQRKLHRLLLRFGQPRAGQQVPGRSHPARRGHLARGHGRRSDVGDHACGSGRAAGPVPQAGVLDLRTACRGDRGDHHGSPTANPDLV